MSNLEDEIIEVLELINLEGDPEGHKSRKWRLTVRSSEKSNPRALCSHMHNSYEDAWNCLEAWEAAKKLTGDSDKR